MVYAVIVLIVIGFIVYSFFHKSEVDKLEGQMREKNPDDDLYFEKPDYSKDLDYYSATGTEAMNKGEVQNLSSEVSEENKKEFEWLDWGNLRKCNRISANTENSVSICDIKKSEPDLEKLKLCGNVKSLTESLYTVNRKNNRIVRDKIKSDIFGEKGIYVSFNKKGYKLSETIFDSDREIHERYSFDYNEDGNLIEENVYSSEGTLLKCITYKYEIKEDMNLLVHLIADSDRPYDCKYRYNKGGKCVEIIHSSTAAITFDKTKIKYNSIGEKLEEITYWNNGVPYIVITYENKKDGYTKVEKEYFIDGVMEDGGVMTRYDKDGNLIYRHDSDGETSYKYNERGDKIEVLNIYSGEYCLIHYSYEYDNKGNWIVKNDLIQIIEDATYPYKTYIDADYGIITKRKIEYYKDI